MVRARQALAQGRCRRETPITLTLADGTLVEGVLDLAFREEDAWTVVDFKTDRELEKERQHYKRQIGLYAAAISLATGKSASAFLLFV
jgi:ATP-dependent exoDNAse (exonuclease V) beta subunit